VVAGGRRGKYDRKQNALVPLVIQELIPTTAKKMVFFTSSSSPITVIIKKTIFGITY
jgi:hypothetical protein